jgi:WD40 repeat protein
VLSRSPDVALLATASDDGTARIWDLATGTTRTTLKGHTGRVWGVAFSPDGTLLATASDDGTARIWDAANGAALAVLVAVPDGGYAVLAADGYKIEGDIGDHI